jgi:microcystin-dependent protein
MSSNKTKSVTLARPAGVAPLLGTRRRRRWPVAYHVVALVAIATLPLVASSYTKPHRDFMPGEPALASEINETIDDIYAALNDLDGRMPPVGTVSWYAGLEAPEGWLLCNGSEVGRAEEPELFAVIGTIYGDGDEVTTFNLPDVRGRVLIATGAGDGLTERLLGAAVGSEAHTLTEAEMPSHGHGVNDPGHNHSFGLYGNTGGGPDEYVHHSDPFGGYFGSHTTSTVGTGISLSASGSSQPHPIMQPSLALHCIIRR